MDKLRKKLLANRDDLAAGTFCHTLFEEGEFNENLLGILVNDLATYAKMLKNDDREMRELLRWIVEGVDQCFVSHHAADDLFYIKNYFADCEERWRRRWKTEIKKYTPSEKY